MIGFDFPWEAILGRPSLAGVRVRLGAPGPFLATPGLFALFLWGLVWGMAWPDSVGGWWMSVHGDEPMPLGTWLSLC